MEKACLPKKVVDVLTETCMPKKLESTFQPKQFPPFAQPLTDFDKEVYDFVKERGEILTTNMHTQKNRAIPILKKKGEELKCIGAHNLLLTHLTVFLRKDSHASVISEYLLAFLLA